MKKLLLLFAFVLPALSATAQTNPTQQWINGYYRKDGSYVEGHWRTAPNNTKADNLGYTGGQYPIGNSAVLQQPNLPYMNYQYMDEMAYYNAINREALERQFKNDYEIIKHQIEVAEQQYSNGFYEPAASNLDRALSNMRVYKLDKGETKGDYQAHQIKLAFCYSRLGNTYAMKETLRKSSWLIYKRPEVAVAAANCASNLNEFGLVEKYLKQAIRTAKKGNSATKYYDSLQSFYTNMKMKDKADKLAADLSRYKEKRGLD